MVGDSVFQGGGVFPLRSGDKGTASVRFLDGMKLPCLYKLWKPGQYGQWIVAITACFCSFTTGQVFAWPSAALPKLRSGEPGFLMSPVEESWMVSATFLGNFISPIPAGYIMDRIGRKNTLLVFDLLAVTSWLVTLFWHSPIGLYISRTLIGTWAGFVYTVVPVLVGEVVQPEIRGSMGALFGVMLYLGGMYESLIAIYFSYDVLSMCSLIPPVVLFIILLLLPESPYYYLMKGNRLEATTSLEWLRGEFNSEDLDEMEESVKEQLECRGTFLDIIKVRPYRRAFIIAETLGIVQRLAGLTLLMSYATVTIPDSWLTAQESFTVLVSVWIAGSIFSFFIMDMIGRRTMFIISATGSSLTMILISIWYYLRDFTSLDLSSSQWFPLIGLIVNGAAYSLGMISIPTLIQGELFPINIKGKSSAVVTITMSVTSAVTARLYQPLCDYVGVYSNFVICAVSCAVGAIFACLRMVETKGKSLEEIQDILSEKKRKRKKKVIT